MKVAKLLTLVPALLLGSSAFADSAAFKFSGECEFRQEVRRHLVFQDRQTFQIETSELGYHSTRLSFRLPSGDTTEYKVMVAARLGTDAHVSLKTTWLEASGNSTDVRRAMT